MVFLFFNSSLGRPVTSIFIHNLRLFYMHMHTHAHTYVRAYMWIIFRFILYGRNFFFYLKQGDEFQTYELKCSAEYFICLFVVYFKSLWIHHRKCRQMTGWSVSHRLGRTRKKISVPSIWYYPGIWPQGRRFLDEKLKPGLPCVKQDFYLLGLHVTFRKF
jgi:hypothetical protein